jgi:hypothetical protein
VQSQTYSHTSVITRLNSWFQKSRDSAVGTSFDVHVMGGYKFLMKYYETGDGELAIRQARSRKLMTKISTSSASVVVHTLRASWQRCSTTSGSLSLATRRW